MAKSIVVASYQRLVCELRIKKISPPVSRQFELLRVEWRTLIKLGL